MKHKVKAHFSHKGKQYKPGDDFESDDQQEVHQLAQQGHIEKPQGQQQGQDKPGQEKSGSSGGSQQSGSQSGGSKASGAGAAGDDPSKSKQ